VIWFSVRNGEFTNGGIDDIIKGNGHIALHLPLNSTDSNPTEFVCEGIRNSIASKNLKEMQTFCKSVFAEYTKE
jgi:hypothetical protein